MIIKTLHFKNYKYFCQLYQIAVLTLMFYFCNTYAFHENILQAAPVQIETNNSLDKATDFNSIMLTSDYYALPEFSSELPIVVIYIQGDTAAKEQYGYFLNADILVYAGNTANTLNSSPSFSQVAKIRNMTDTTNASQLKHDYFLSFVDQHSLLGLSTSKEYLLLGAMNDKSLIRNYIGYIIAAKVMSGAPEISFCEVFIRTSEGDLYQGVYTLVEKSTKDEDILFHRSIQGEGINIETYSTRNDPVAGKMSIPFIESLLWSDRFNEPIGRLSRAEEILYSTDSRTFYMYRERFDVSSFISNFIIGELTQNYAGMNDVYYYYNTETDTIALAPIWNFEQAFDNQILRPAIVDQMYHDRAPYYKQFFKSPRFANEIQDSYLVYRNKVLSEPQLLQIVNDATKQVSSAVQRDWRRWNSYSHYKLQTITQLEEKDEILKIPGPFSRQTKTYNEEILRIKYQLREHSLHTAVNITRFDFSEQEVSKEIVLNSNPVWPILFIFAFFLLVRFVRRYGI